MDLAYELHSKNKALALQQESNHKSKVILLIIILICVVCLISGGVFTFLQIKKVRLQKRVFSLIGEVDQAKFLNANYENYKNQTSEIILRNAETMGRILEIYNSMHSSGKKPQKSLAEIQASLDHEVKEIDTKSIEKSVNWAYNGVVTTLREEMPDLGEDNFKLFIFTLIGWKAQTIATYFNTTRNNIYQRRNRLIKIFEDSDAPHKDHFLNLFKNPMENLPKDSPDTAG